MAAEEVVFDELHVSVEAERLVVDVPVFGVRTDDDGGHPEPIAVHVDLRWRDVVVEATPVVPCEEDGRRVPVGALHHRVHEAGDVRLTRADAPGRVFAHRL